MSLKVFDLQCEHGHVFEGWFASAEAYENQKAGGLLTCPLCNSTEVTRKVSAARLNVSNLKRERLQPSSGSSMPAPVSGELPQTVEPSAAASADTLARIQAEIIQHIRKVLRETENVGSRFAEESRRMHYGDAEPRPIRGTATLEERQELAEEGIAVVAIPDFLDDDRLQ